VGNEPVHPLGADFLGEVPTAGKTMWAVELDFVVLDSADHVAVFTTAGFGPMPLEVVDHWNEVNDAVDLARSCFEPRRDENSTDGPIARKPTTPDGAAAGLHLRMKVLVLGAATGRCRWCRRSIMERLPAAVVQ
jgi:hypothetical protein